MQCILSLTHQCNLRCRYCYAGDKVDRKMSPEVMDKALRWAFSGPHPLVKLAPFGGEPLMEPELLERMASEGRRLATKTGKELQLRLTTNGTLLTSAYVALLARYGFGVVVSLDGDREAHDSARVYADGRSSFEDVVAGLRRVMREIPRCATVSVVHPGNAQRLVQSFDFLTSLGVSAMTLTLNYHVPWPEEALRALEESLEALADRLIARSRAGYDDTVHPLWGKIISHLKDGYAFGDRCDFGSEEVAVAPSGRIYPCDRVIGNDGPAEAFLVIGDVDHGIDRKRMEALRGAKNRSGLECRECALEHRCMWWCGAVNVALTGRVDQVSDLLCTTEQLFVRAADRIASTLYAEKNPVFLKQYYRQLEEVARGFAV